MPLLPTLLALAGLAAAAPAPGAAPVVVADLGAGGGGSRAPEVDGVALADAQAIWQIELLRVDAAALRVFLERPEPAVRARAARAVGRLRQEGAARLLARVAEDPDAGVRAEVAFALGLTPGAGDLLAKRWAVEKDRHVRAALATALGRQGGPGAVDLLIEALHGPNAADAADGLGRLGMRKVHGATSDRVVAALLDVMRGAPVGDARQNAAWALSRMGLTRTSDENAMRMRQRLLEDGDARVRASLVRAWAGVAGQAARAEVLAVTARDADARVRIATARAVAREGWKDAAPVLAPLLADPELDVRLEAIAAVAECPGIDAKALLAQAWASPVPHEKAAALRALAKRGALPERPSRLVAVEHPMVVRIAAVESLQDRNRLLSLALRSKEPPLRSAAVATLLDRPPARLDELLELLGARDPVIAQAAADTLTESPDPGAEKALLTFLARRDLPLDAADSAVRALDAIYATGRLPRPGPEVAKTLEPWLRLHRLDDVRDRFATLLKIDPPRPRHPDRKVPDLADVLAIRSARVFTERGEIRIALHPEEAPYTVWNFATLAEKGWYDGLEFHRVVPDFVVQTGDPRGDGWGGPGYEIPDELNPTPYAEGVVGMALSGPDTGGSQWFVTLSAQPHLDAGYTAFGRVTYGMRVAQDLVVGDRIEKIVIERVPRGG